MDTFGPVDCEKNEIGNTYVILKPHDSSFFCGTLLQFQSIANVSSNKIQWDPKDTGPFSKYFHFCRRKKILQVWNDVRTST